MYGVEGQGGWAGLFGDSLHLLSGPPPTTTVHSRVDALGTLTARIGYAWGPVLLYAKGGLALTRDSYQLTDPIVPLPDNCGREGEGVKAVLMAAQAPRELVVLWVCWRGLPLIVSSRLIFSSSKSVPTAISANSPAEVRNSFAVIVNFFALPWRRLFVATRTGALRHRCKVITLIPNLSAISFCTLPCAAISLACASKATISALEVFCRRSSPLSHVSIALVAVSHQTFLSYIFPNLPRYFMLRQVGIGPMRE